MTTHAERGQAAPSEAPVGERGIYVYGILAADKDIPTELTSVGDEETDVRLASHEGLAALISDVPLKRPLGTPEDLLAHERVLDTIAAEWTVLPMRFGAVVSTVDAIIEELLAPNKEFFEAALVELDGCVQFNLRGRYVDSAHLREIVDEEPNVRALRDELRDVPESAGYEERLRLGELVSAAVEKKRVADVERVMATVSPIVVTTVVHEVVGEDEAFEVACLVDRARQEEFDRAVDELSNLWRNRVHLRQIGPLAPYDFVPEE